MLDSFKRSIIKKIKLATEEIGFFTVTNHGIPLPQIENLLSTCKKFFYLPKNEKIKIAPKKWNHNTETIYRGYFPSEVNGKEGLDIGDPKLTIDMNNLQNGIYYLVIRDNYKSILKRIIKN